jgi:hypothetical protein
VTTARGTGGTPGWVRLVPSVIGAVGLVAVAPFYLSSGLMAPLWAVLLFVAIWVGLAILAVRCFRSRPLVVLALPVLAIAFWWAGMSAGEAWLDWTP